MQTEAMRLQYAWYLRNCVLSADAGDSDGDPFLARCRQTDSEAGPLPNSRRSLLGGRCTETAPERKTTEDTPSHC
jgi:hypothetical protein